MNISNDEEFMRDLHLGLYWLCMLFGLWAIHKQVVLHTSEFAPFVEGVVRIWLYAVPPAVFIATRARRA